MFYIIMLILSSFTKLYALDAGVSYEIKRFQQDIGTAAPIIEDALTKQKFDQAGYTAPQPLQPTTVCLKNFPAPLSGHLDHLCKHSLSK